MPAPPRGGFLFLRQSDMERLFERVEVLDKVKHKDLRWFCLGKDCPSSCCYLPVSTNIILDELVSLSRHFPLVFVHDGKGWSIHAIFKLSNDKSMPCVHLRPRTGCALGEEKPLACKQYPFFTMGLEMSDGKIYVVPKKSEKMAINMDLGCPGFSQTQGEPVLQDGVLNPYFEENFVAPARTLLNRWDEMRQFVDAVVSNELIRGGKFVYKDEEIPINYVDEVRLTALPRDTIIDFREKGYLRYIYAHLASLQNFIRLIKVKKGSPYTNGR